jgi:hypothetical protein
MSVGPSDSRSDEASRDEHSDRAHALLPADIFSSTVQLGAPIRVVFRVMLVGSDLRRCGCGISASEAHPPSEL